MKKTKLIFTIILFLSAIVSVKAQEYLKPETDGQVLSEIGSLSKNFLIGLTPPFRTKDADITPYIAYSFLVSNGSLYVMEYGKVVMTAGSISLGDSIKIKREGSFIKYYKNEINIKTNSTEPKYDLAIYKLGEDIPEMRTGFEEKITLSAFVSNITVNDSDESGIIDVNPIGGVPPYTYQWSTGATTKYINNLEVGEYEVAVYDSKGQSLKQKYDISYFVTATVPNTFILENGLIVKAQDSDDMEMMISENNVNGEGSFKAAFEGENISFIFGLNSDKTQYNDAKKINYGVLTLENQMYFIEEGNMVAAIGEYVSGAELMLDVVNNGQTLIVKIGEKDIYKTELNTSVYYSTIALFKGAGGLIKWKTPLKWKPTGENDFYATLTKKLDGSFYTFKNYIKFKYNEKYNDNIIDYKVYNWKREVKMTSANQPISGHKYGINYHRLAAFNQLDSDFEGYYTLEATNDKGEVYKMRFYFEKVGTNGVILIPSIVTPVAGAPACCFEPIPCTMKQCTTPTLIINNCNPCN